MIQFFQQRFRLLQVFGIKPLGEPAVDLRQCVACCVVLALLLPEASEAHHGSQLQGLGTLAAGNLDGLVKTGFSFRLRLGARCWALGAGVFGLVLTCLELARDLSWTETLAALSADIALPRDNAPHFCPQKLMLRLAPSALLRPVPLVHMPGPRDQDNMTVIPLLPWLGGRPSPGTSGQSLPFPVPARSVPSPERECPTPPTPETLRQSKR